MKGSEQFLSAVLQIAGDGSGSQREGISWSGMESVQVRIGGWIEVGRPSQDVADWRSLEQALTATRPTGEGVAQSGA